MARIELRNIVKTYGSFNAVQNLDMTIEDGELLVLLGPSGCGKSTTMNMIAGLTNPTSGQILFDGADVTRHSPHERNIAMVFQSSLLYPHLSARDNIYMSLKRSGLSRKEIEARIARAAETVDVTRLLDKLPSQLSGGERQRIAIARAILRDAPLLLLDEATSALDAENERLVQTALANLMVGRTTLVIAHRLATIQRLERIVVMDEGHVVAEGTHAQLVAQGGLYARLASLQFQGDAA